MFLEACWTKKYWAVHECMELAVCGHEFYHWCILLWLKLKHRSCHNSLSEWTVCAVFCTSASIVTHSCGHQPLPLYCPESVSSAKQEDSNNSATAFFQVNISAFQGKKEEVIFSIVKCRWEMPSGVLSHAKGLNTDYSGHMSTFCSYLKKRHFGTKCLCF